MWCLTLLSWNLARSLFAKTETLLLHPSMIPSPAYCDLFQNSLTLIFYNLITFILPLSQRFWNVLQPSKSKFVHIYKIHLRWSVKTLKSFLCAFVNQIKVKENKQITDSWFYFIFTKRFNFSGIGVVQKLQCNTNLWWPQRHAARSQTQESPGLHFWVSNTSPIKMTNGRAHFYSKNTVDIHYNKHTVFICVLYFSGNVELSQEETFLAATSQGYAIGVHGCVQTRCLT